MRISSMSRLGAVAAIALVQCFARPVPATAAPGENLLRGAEVGKLHDVVLARLLATAPPCAEGPTPDELERLLDRSRVETLERLDLSEAARIRLPDGRTIADVVRDVLRDAPREIVELYRRAGAFAPQDPQGAVLRLRPQREALPAVLRQLAADGVLSPAAAEALASLTERIMSGELATHGDVVSEARRVLGGGTWEGIDGLAADAYLSTLQQSLGFWREASGGTDAPHVMSRLGDIAASDATGAAVGGATGGVGGAIAVGALVGAGVVAIGATAGAAVPIVIAVGAAAGGTAALVGATCSYVQSQVDPSGPPASGGQTSGGQTSGGQTSGGQTSGGQTGGSTGGSTGGQSGGSGGSGGQGGSGSSGP